MKPIRKRLRVTLQTIVVLLLLFLGLAGHSSTVIAQSGTFTPTGSMRTPRSGHTATLLLNGKVLVAGGEGPRRQQYLASAELYDPSTGTFAPTGNMATVRLGHTATLLPDGKVLVTGGRGQDINLLASAELYDPANGTFTPTGDLTGAWMGHTATLLPDGKVLLIADGYRPAELYDPSTRTFTATGNMTTAWYGHTATLLPDGKVLVVGDGDIDRLYDPVSGTFRLTGKLATPSDSHTATLLTNGKVLVAGGFLGALPGQWGPSEASVIDRAEQYDPSTGTFAPTGNMTTTRAWHTSTLLPDGRVLTAGGVSCMYTCSELALSELYGHDSAELYDPVAGTFSPAPKMTTARSSHTATLLNNGRVLIAGGNGPQFDMVYASAELYTPPAGSIARTMAVGTSLLVPSAVYSDEFVSSLVILNIDNEPNKVTISFGEYPVLRFTITLGLAERFRSANILQQLGAAPGSSGPILISSNNGRLLSAVSEVSSSRGAAGVFPAVNLEAAWTQGFILDAMDNGPLGMPGTYRTNLGVINTSGSSATNVTMALFNSFGQQVGNPLTIPVGIDCYTGCPDQINTIVQRLRGSAGVTEGYLKISSAPIITASWKSTAQPIVAWASKVENGTDDPSFQIATGAASSVQPSMRSNVGSRLLVPSSIYSELYTSSLAVLNVDSQPNSLTISAYDTRGKPLAPPFATTLAAGAQFRSTNILQQLGAALGSFGPIKIESSNNRLLSAVSEVRGNQGLAGFLPGVNLESAWTQGFILEAADSGARGTPATYRTNLGLNAVSPGSTKVTVTLFNDSGRQVGNSVSATVAADGLAQLDNVVQRLGGKVGVTGGYLRIVSSQPIIAWASKIENGSDDPSFQIGIGATSEQR